MSAPIIIPQVRVPEANANASASKASANRAEKAPREDGPVRDDKIKAPNENPQASFMAFVNNLIATKPANGDTPLATQLSGAGMKQIAVPSDILENLYNEDGSVNEDGLNAFAAFISTLSDSELNPTFGAAGDVILAGQAGDDILSAVQAKAAAAAAADAANQALAADKAALVDVEEIVDVLDKPVDLSAFNEDEKAKIAAALKDMSEDAGMDIIRLPRAAQKASAEAHAHANAHAVLQNPQTPSPQGQATAAAQAGSVVPPEAMPAKWFDVAGAEKRTHSDMSLRALVQAGEGDEVHIQMSQNTNTNAKNGQGAQHGLQTAASVAQSAGAPGLGKQGSADFAALLEQFAGETPDVALDNAALDDADMAAAARFASHISPSAPSFAVAHVMPASVSGAAVSQQVAAAMAKAGVKDATQKISVSLNPAELGKVMVDISRDDAQKVKVVLSAEKPSSLHLLQKDSTALQQALQDAGLDLSNMDLQFSFSGEGFGSNESREGRFSGMGRNASSSVPVQDIDISAAEALPPHGIYYDPASGAARYHALV